MKSLALGVLLALPLLTSALGEPRGRPNQSADTCYSVAYDSIQPGVGVEILPKTLRRSPGTDRGRLVTDDTIPTGRGTLRRERHGAECNRGHDPFCAGEALGRCRTAPPPNKRLKLTARVD